jgi:hypothetical protein
MDVGRFSGVRVYRGGQKNVLGSYPLHFHLVGNCPTCHIKDCAVERSFFRCFTLHQTHDALVTRNVAFNAWGHCYYLEEGVEENNTLSFNLGANIHCIKQEAAGGGQEGQTFKAAADLLLPADVAASAYYITNAYNTIVGNTGSGGWSVFAFPNLPGPTGLARTNPRYANVKPDQRPTLVSAYPLCRICPLSLTQNRTHTHDTHGTHHARHTRRNSMVTRCTRRVRSSCTAGACTWAAGSGTTRTACRPI